MIRNCQHVEVSTISDQMRMEKFKIKVCDGTGKICITTFFLSWYFLNFFSGGETVLQLLWKHHKYLPVSMDDHVTFVGEPAVDQGGPLREFFHLILWG